VKPYGDNSLHNRHARLAALPKCGFHWLPPSKLGDEIDPFVHEHVCVRPERHSGERHRCNCGVRRDVDAKG